MENANTTTEGQVEEKPPMPFKSIAVMRRCDTLIKAGDPSMTQEKFDKSLAVTDLLNLPSRLTPKKPGREDAEPAESDEDLCARMIARQADLRASAPDMPV